MTRVVSEKGQALGQAGWQRQDESGPGFISRMLWGQQGPPGDSRKQPACLNPPSLVRCLTPPLPPSRPSPPVLPLVTGASVAHPLS